jgi:hypothetical protein
VSDAYIENQYTLAVIITRDFHPGEKPEALGFSSSLEFAQRLLDDWHECNVMMVSYGDTIDSLLYGRTN